MAGAEDPKFALYTLQGIVFLGLALVWPQELKCPLVPPAHLRLLQLSIMILRVFHGANQNSVSGDKQEIFFKNHSPGPHIMPTDQVNVCQQVHPLSFWISIGQAVYLLYTVLSLPLSVDYFLCEGGRKAALLFACEGSSFQQASDALRPCLLGFSTQKINSWQ